MLHWRVSLDYRLQSGLGLKSTTLFVSSKPVSQCAMSDLVGEMFGSGSGWGRHLNKFRIPAFPSFVMIRKAEKGLMFFEERVDPL